MKDDSGSYAVFTEEGSSASQMTAAKVLDVFARLSRCAGQASDAASAYAHVKMEDAPILLKLPKSECPDIWVRLPRYKWTKGLQNIGEPVVPLERHLCGHPLAALLCARQFENILLQKWMRESTKLGMSVRPSPTRINLIRIRGRLQNGRERQNLELMWTILMNKIDLEKPTPFLEKNIIGMHSA